MAATILSVAEVSVLKTMDAGKRPLYFDIIANARRIPIADIEKAYADLLVKADELSAAEKAKADEAARVARVDKLRAEVEAYRLEGDDEFLMLNELRDSAVELGIVVTFGGLVEGEPRFSLGTLAAPKVASTATATATRGGGTGAGRPAADAPQPFVTLDGKRVVGPVTLWLKANVDAAILTAKGLMKADGNLKGSGSVVAAAAVKAGILIASPVPEAPATVAPAATADSPALPGA